MARSSTPARLPKHILKSYLSDARGTKYFWTCPPNTGARGPINFNAMAIAANDRTHSYFYQLNLAQYPKSVGTLKLNTTFVARNGFKLPVSVVVRP